MKIADADWPGPFAIGRLMPLFLLGLALTAVRIGVQTGAGGPRIVAISCSVRLGSAPVLSEASGAAAVRPVNCGSARLRRSPAVAKDTRVRCASDCWRGATCARAQTKPRRPGTRDKLMLGSGRWRLRSARHGGPHLGPARQLAHSHKYPNTRLLSAERDLPPVVLSQRRIMRHTNHRRLIKLTFE